MDTKIQILVNYRQAESILVEKIKNIKTGHLDYNTEVDGIPIQVPSEYKDPIWKMDEISLKNTLKYLFQISHQCYVLSMEDQVPNMYKLMPPLQKVYTKALEEAFKKLKDNPHLTDEQRKRIVKVKPVRVMQCVVKEHVNKDIETNEYQSVLSRLNLPDGMYILNLTDAIILRKDWKHPFPMVVGNVPMTRYPSFLPILSMSGQKGYSDIPIPNYDEIEWVYKKENIYENFITDWSKKTIDKAVFRGGPTGCGYTAETNMRVKLSVMSKDPMFENDLDVGISGKGKTIDTFSLRFDPKFGLGMLNTGILPTDKFLKMYEQSQYKYIIHIDGNVNAYRMFYTMSTGSLILRVMSDYTSWAEQYLKPNEHYIPIQSDLSNLKDVLEWCKKNQSSCKKIAENGLRLSRTILSADFLDNYFKMIFTQISVSKTDVAPIKQIAEDGLYVQNIIMEDIRVKYEDCGRDMENYFLEYAKDRIEGRCRNEGFVKPGSAKIVSYTSGNIRSDQVQFRVLYLFDVCFPYEGMKVECMVKSVSKIGIRATMNEPSPMVVYVMREHNAFLDYKINSKIYVKILGHRYEHNDPFISVFGEII